MKNDIVGEWSPLTRQDLELANSLQRSESIRMESQLWLVRDCKFLVFDDTDLLEKGYDSDDEEDMLKHAMRMSLNEDTHTARFSSNSSKGKEPERQTSQSQPAVDLNETAGGRQHCVVCSSRPMFPRHRKPRKLRLFRPSDEFENYMKSKEVGLPSSNHLCMHYLAVSYCWPVPEQDDDGNIVEEPRTYTIRELDGSLRKNRALDDVLDRAIDMATECGLRMIWIDQECIPQPDQPGLFSEEDKKEQAIGVQAMDILYSRAAITAGLLSAELSNQLQANAVHDFIETFNEMGPAELNTRFPLVIDFLDTVCKDRWYTRAWVVQEALSAGDNLQLVMHRAPGITFDLTFNVTGPATMTYPGNPLSEEYKKFPSGVTPIPMRLFQRLVKNVDFLLKQTAFRQAGSMTVRATIWQRPAEEIVSRAYSLHPEHFRPRHESFRMFQTGPNIHGFVHSTDAAGAISFLRTRHCRDTEDFITIAANMCAYEVRVDAKIVAASCDSLRIALLALALMNGDYSILAPEAYAMPAGPSHQEDNDAIPRWLSPFHSNVGLLNHFTVRTFNFRVVQNLPARGLCEDFPAYLWKVGFDDCLDLMPVKIRWRDEWENLFCLSVVDTPQKGETRQSVVARTERIMAYIQRPSIQSRVYQELLENGYVTPESPLWHGFDQPRRIEPFIVASRIESDPSLRRSLANIIFDILRFLLNQANDDQRALGVADSIWQSLRVDQVQAYPNLPLPDVVCQELFDHPAVLSTPFETLRLDRDNDGSYHQSWLVRRVMSHGALWVGQYIRNTHPLSVRNVPLPALREKLATNRQNVVSSRLTGSGQSDPTDTPRIEGWSGMLYKQAMKRMTINKFQIIAFSKFSELSEDGKGSKDQSDLTSGALTGLLLALGTDFQGPESEELRVLSRVSVFDVDGPCTVATIYSDGWEMIPHPDMRSMSVCWVVEHCWSANYDDFDINTVFDSDGNLSKHAVDVQGEYRVVDKVKGMWEVMEQPQQRYIFK